MGKGKRVSSRSPSTAVVGRKSNPMGLEFGSIVGVEDGAGEVKAEFIGVVV